MNTGSYYNDSKIVENLVSWKQWLAMKSDPLPALAFTFISRRNFSGGRFLPLFNKMTNLRIVAFYGTHFGKLDFIYLKLLKIFVRITHKKQLKYKWIMSLGINVANPKVSQILNIDDPQYNTKEHNHILSWEDNLRSNGSKSIIVTTNTYTKLYLENLKINSPVHIIEQGHNSISGRSAIKNSRFSCVYSSPYIDLGNDKHGNHPTWGSRLFITSLIPMLIKRDPEIEIHLIGRVGKQASDYLKKYRQVIVHGMKNYEDNFTIISKCHVGLYPRQFDNQRRVLKVYEYLGAGVPVVTFELEDTKMVKEKKIGISVKTPTEFIEAIINLKQDHNLYSKFLRSIELCGDENSWTTLAIQYDNMIQSNFSD
jgi:hypothetical protein